jgi:membrane-associated protein
MAVNPTAPRHDGKPVHAASLIPWLSPETIISGAGPWALLVVLGIVFAETGLLVGFILPGDTLLVITGLLINTQGLFGLNVWVVALLISIAAFLGGEMGYYIGRKAGPAVFERRESGLFSRKNVERTNAFFARYGGMTVILARFVPVVRTFAPVVAGVGHMPRRRYTLYNAIGAVAWCFGITLLGYVIGYIPPVAAFVTKYIDVILVGVVVLSVGVTIVHYLRERSKAHKHAAEADQDAPADGLEASGDQPA